MVFPEQINVLGFKVILEVALAGKGVTEVYHAEGQLVSHKVENETIYGMAFSARTDKGLREFWISVKDVTTVLSSYPEQMDELTKLYDFDFKLPTTPAFGAYKEPKDE